LLLQQRERCFWSAITVELYRDGYHQLMNIASEALLPEIRLQPVVGSSVGLCRTSTMDQDHSEAYP
jgi:hypothetical protein